MFTTIEAQHQGSFMAKVKDIFKVPPPTTTNTYVEGKVIGGAYIEAADLRELQKLKVSEFEAIVELEKVGNIDGDLWWRITDFAFDGKELPLQEWLSKKGFLPHGSPDNGVLPRSDVKNPQDGLHHNPSAAARPPSRFDNVAKRLYQPPLPPDFLLALSEDQMTPTPVFPEKLSSQPTPPVICAPAPATPKSVVTSATQSPNSWSLSSGLCSEDGEALPSPEREEFVFRPIFPRDKTEQSVSNHTVTNVEDITRRNGFCGPTDPIYDIMVNLEKESSDTTFIIEVIAMIAFVKEEFIVAFCPLKGYDKIVIPWNIFQESAYVAEGHPVEPGHWMTLNVHPRQSQPFDATSPPQFTHFATSDPDYIKKLCHVNIKDSVGNWEQRCVNGRFEFLVMIDLSKRYITITRLNQDFYVFATKQQVDVIVPAHRFDPLKSMDYPQFARFWAIRDVFLFKRTLHLMADVEVEVLKNGLIMTHLLPHGHPPSKTAPVAENSLLPLKENSLDQEIPFAKQALEDPHRDPSLLQEDAHNDPLKAAHAALSCLDSEDIVKAFLEEDMEEELVYLLGLRNAVEDGEASLNAYKRPSERSA